MILPACAPAVSLANCVFSIFFKRIHAIVVTAAVVTDMEIRYTYKQNGVMEMTV